MSTNPIDTIFDQIVGFIRAQYPNRYPIPLHEPIFEGNEKKYLLDVIDSTYVSSVGEYVDRFEKIICDITGTKYAVATVNGTTALHTALMAAGVRPGDEVITQAISFVATANSIAHCGAEPIFVDIDKRNFGMSPDSLSGLLRRKADFSNGACRNRESGKKISACMPVHTFGHPCQIDLIIEICSEYGIPVIEDASEALGSTYRGKYAGTYGLMGIFSFNGNKIVTSGGGGVIVTDDEITAKKAKHLSTTARVAHAYEYNHDSVGYNYRMPNLNAALACAQLERLDGFIESKRCLAESYGEFFHDTAFFFLKEPEGARSNYWLNGILLTDSLVRDRFLKFSNSNGVSTRAVWKPLNLLPMYVKCQSENLSNTDWFASRAVNIPSSVTL